VTRLIRADGENRPVGWLSARCWLAGKLIMQYYRRDLLTRRVPGPAEGSSPCCAALLRGGSAPDALRHGLKRVGQAVRADGATAADRLRRFDLPGDGACYRRDGKEQLGIRLPAGGARHPTQGARSGRYGQHCKPPAGPRRRQRRQGGEPRAGR
jgi:hypothetical protein